MTEILLLLDEVILEEQYCEVNSWLETFDLTDALWTLPNRYEHYTMHIMANLATEKHWKVFLQGYLQRIIIKMTFSHEIKEYYVFIYNWFNSQDF